MYRIATRTGCFLFVHPTQVRHPKAIDFPAIDFLTPIVYWPLIEASLQIIAACLPMLRALVKGSTQGSLLSRLRGKRSGYVQSYDPESRLSPGLEKAQAYPYATRYVHPIFFFAVLIRICKEYTGLCSITHRRCRSVVDGTASVGHSTKIEHVRLDALQPLEHSPAKGIFVHRTLDVEV